MATYGAFSGVDIQGRHLEWTLVGDDIASTITITAIYTFNAQPAPDPTRAWVTFQLNNNQSLTVDMVANLVGDPNGDPNDPATVLTNTQPFSATPGSMLNAGPRVRTNVKLKVSTNRAAGITHSTYLLP